MIRAIIGFVLCSAWLVFVFCYSIKKRQGFRILSPLALFVGATLNDLALAANGWRMPVLAKHASYLDGAHTLLTAKSALPFLCDIFIGGSSIGDWFLFLGSLLAFSMLVVYPTQKP